MRKNTQIGVGGIILNRLITPIDIRLYGYTTDNSSLLQHIAFFDLRNPIRQIIKETITQK